MPIYEFKCPHRHIQEIFAHHPPTPPICSICNLPTHRIFSFNVQPVMQETFVPSIGKSVSSVHQIAEHGKRLSEEHHQRDGLPHNYIPQDYRDKSAVGVTNEGLHEQAGRWHDMGRPDIAKRIESQID